MAWLHHAGHSTEWELRRLKDMLPHVCLDDPDEMRCHFDNEVATATGSGSSECLSLFQEEWRPQSLTEGQGSNGAGLEKPWSIVLVSSANLKEEFLNAGRRIEDCEVVAFVARETESFAEEFDRIRVAHGKIDAVWYLAGIGDPAEVETPQIIVRFLRGLDAAGLSGSRVLLAGECNSMLRRCHVDSWIGFESSLNPTTPNARLSTIQAEVAEDDDRSVPMSHRINEWLQRCWAESRADRIENALYIGAERHVLHRRPLAIPSLEQSPAFRTGGTYLITGGMGTLGFSIAEYLSKHYRANVVLTGRSPLDATKRDRLRAFAKWGGQAVYLQADVADRKLMGDVLEVTIRCFGRLHGVIHAAGVVGGGGLMTREAVSTQSIWSAKIDGTQVLAELSRGRVNDFVCYFSSVAALGDFGSCAEAVANRFELAHAQYAESGALAIGWPKWLGADREDEEERADRLDMHSIGQQGLSFDSGMSLLERLLAHHRASGLTHAIVMTGDGARIRKLAEPAHSANASPTGGERKLPAAAPICSR